MARSLCLDNSDPPHHNARPRRDAARVGQHYLLQDDDDVDDDVDDDDDDDDVDDDDDAETDEDEDEDEEEEEETWQVAAITPIPLKVGLRLTSGTELPRLAPIFQLNRRWN